MTMNAQTISFEKTLLNLIETGNTALNLFGINGDLMTKIEAENPHIAKQYPWQESRKEAC
ncbi:hypothetical protein [uncultured Psychrosphaera sp.]|uniref:hypothetical protein n=1 Tax=uncultured Psychrosphaera sp. TaxID=1403522 RepID=UPI00262C75BE|nr:hypothetical protein [uncultured Psychrosphaera sp.]